VLFSNKKRKRKRKKGVSTKRKETKFWQTKGETTNGPFVKLKKKILNGDVGKK